MDDTETGFVIREEDRLLLPREVAAMFGVQPITVTRWADKRAGDGTFDIVRTPSGQRRYRETQVRGLLAAGMAGVTR